jgi:hypothetical protein
MEVFNEHGDGTDMKQERVPSIDWAFRVVRKKVRRNRFLASTPKTMVVNWDRWYRESLNTVFLYDTQLV